MMRQANEDFGFEVNDKPLMVEAIPVSPENIVLLITKVEDGDERGSSLAKLFSSNKEEDVLIHLTILIRKNQTTLFHL